MTCVRRFIDAAALSALLLGAGLTGFAVTSSAEAAQGIRAVATVCMWGDLEWAQLSDAERRQWIALGWSQARWESDDEGAYPASWSKDWEDLNMNERSAAWALGYTPRTWDDDLCD